MVASQSQYRPPPQALSVLVLVENSATIASDWLNLRDHYIRTTIASLKASNATVPMNVMVLPSLPPQSDEQLWPVPQRYGELQNFEFNLHPSNKLSAGHIYSGIEFLSSCHTGAFSTVARHIFIVAATTPSDNISGIDTAGKPVWSFLARKLFEANIYCHLIVSQTNDVSSLMSLFEETIKLQGNVEHTFPVMSWFAANAQIYALRLAAHPYPHSSQVPTVQSGAYNSVSQQEPPTSPPLEQATNNPIVFMEPLGTAIEESPNLVSQIQQLHGLARKKSGVQAPRRALFRDDPASLGSGSTPAENTQGGRAMPSYKLERSSRVGLNPGSMSRSRSGSTSQSARGGSHSLVSNVISTFTPGVTTLLPIPPAPTSSSPSPGTSRPPQLDLFNAQTLLPIPPAPNSVPSPPSSTPSRQISFDKLNSMFPVPPPATSSPSTTLGMGQTLNTEGTHFYPAEFTKSSSGSMSAILPVPQPPAPTENEASSSSPPYLPPANADNAATPHSDSAEQQSSFLEDDEAILDALLDPNHHFTLDLFQTNLLQLLDADEAKTLLTSPRSKSKESSNPGTNPVLVRDQASSGASAAMRAPMPERLIVDNASSSNSSSPARSAASSHNTTPTTPFSPAASSSRTDLLATKQDDFQRKPIGDDVRSTRFTSPPHSLQLANQPLPPSSRFSPSAPSPPAGTSKNSSVNAGSPTATRLTLEASLRHRVSFTNHTLPVLVGVPQVNGSNTDSSSLKGWAG